MTITETVTVQEDGKLTLDIVSPDFHKGDSVEIVIRDKSGETAVSDGLARLTAIFDEVAASKETSDLPPDFSVTAKKAGRVE